MTKYSHAIRKSDVEKSREHYYLTEYFARFCIFSLDYYFSLLLLLYRADYQISVDLRSRVLRSVYLSLPYVT